MTYSKELLEKLYIGLLQVRRSEERLVSEYLLGKIPGHIHAGVGEEAPYAGVMLAAEPGDYFKVWHRPVSASRLAGVSYRDMFAEIFGKDTGTSHAHGGVNHIHQLDKGLIGTAGALGCDVAVSVGAGITAQYKNEGKIVFSYYGDGTSSRGPVHEALNMAAAMKLPILFICADNQFAISTDHRESIPVENPGADRAAAYNMPGKVVDGTDVLAVYEAAKELSAYVRGGNGPAILETKCYRWYGHFMGDQCRYRDEEYAAEQRKRDCVKKLADYILSNHIMAQEDLDRMEAGVLAELDDAVAYAESSPEPKVEDIYRNLYV